MLAKIRTVALRDFNAVVRTKGFVIGLLLLPGLMSASVAVPTLLERFGERGERRFAVADFSGRLSAPLLARLEARNREPSQKLKIVVEPIDLAARAIEPSRFAAVRKGLESELAERIRRDELFGFLLIGPRVADIPPPPDAPPDAALAEESSIVYGAASLTAGDLRKQMRDSLNECVRRERLASVGVDPALMQRVDRFPAFEEGVVDRAQHGEGTTRSSGAKEALVPMGIMILLMMGIMQSAGILLNATIEEKSNRVVEVLISSVTPFELLAGKIVGAWMTGLVMLLAWGGAAAFSADQFGVLREGILSPANLAWDAFFFVAGYLLFAALYGAIGSMCNSVQDAQNMMLPVVLLIMIPMVGLSHVMQHPDSAVTTALTFFPFSGALIMPMRLAQSPPPPTWQVVGAAATMLVSVVLLMWIAGKIFRTAILMTGKPPRPSELWRMLKEA